MTVEDDEEQLIVPAPTKNFCKDIAPFTQALMLKTSPDRFDHGSASACRPPWSPHDALCPGPQPEKATRESSCWLRRGDNCGCGAHRLVGRIADAVELGLRIRRHETRGGPVPRSPRSRARAPRQELALRARGWL